MKKRILFIIIGIFTLSVNANCSEFDRILDELDVYPSMSFIETKKPVGFWGTIRRYNDTYQEMAVSFEKNAENKSDIYKTVGVLETQYMPGVRELELIPNEELCHRLLRDLTGLDFGLQVNICIIENPIANAFCTPDGNIFITSKLLVEMGSDYYALLGVAAHEMAHYVLQHAASSVYAQKKRERRNNIIAGVASGIVASTAIYSASQGADASMSDATVKSIDNMFEAAKRDAYIYGFRYGREQELEADIIAYRYLEWLGINGTHYIAALYRIWNEDSELYVNAVDSTHPSMIFRIQLLSYLRDSYQSPASMIAALEFLKENGECEEFSKQDFLKKMQNSSYRRKIYDKLSEKKFPRLGTYREFSAAARKGYRVYFEEEIKMKKEKKKQKLLEYSKYDDIY